MRGLMPGRTGWRDASFRTGVALIAALAPVTPAGAAEFLDLVVNSQTAASAIAPLVARVGEPRTVSLPKGGSILKIIEQRCGGVDPAYFKILQTWNPEIILMTNFAALAKPATIKFPACVRLPTAEKQPLGTWPGSPGSYWRLARNTALPLNTDYLEALSLVRGKTGALPSMKTLSWAPMGYEFEKADKKKNFEQCSTMITNPAAAEKPGKPKKYFACKNAYDIVAYNQHDPRRLAPTANLVIPAVKPAWSSIRLRRDIPADEQNLVTANLKRSIGIGHSSQNDGLRFVFSDPISLEKEKKACLDATKNRGGSKFWPFDVSAVTRILALNDKSRPAGLAPKKTTILVADSGFDFSNGANSRFSTRYIYNAALHDTPNNGIDDNQDYFIDNTTGVNLNTFMPTSATSTRISPLPRSHGLSVAGLALGGVELENFREGPGALLPIKIAHANVMDLGSPGDPIPTAVLGNTLDFATKNDAVIVNMSLAATRVGSLVETTFEKVAPPVSMVIVVAAGNMGKDLEVKRAYPAYYGGNSTEPPKRPVVITVGAHDADGGIASFSNKSSNIVDVLAPGCDVPVYQIEEGPARKAIGIKEGRGFGTSYAAPVVSFVASILASEGLRPEAVKRRIRLSVDYRPILETLVVSSGTLNVAHALAIYHDILNIRAEDKTMEFLGHVQNREDIVTLCGEELKLKSLRRIVRPKSGSQSDQAKFTYILNAPAGKTPVIRSISCVVPEEDEFAFRFRRAQDGNEITVPLSKIDYFLAAR